MTFDEAKQIAVESNAEMRHPGLVNGLVIKAVSGELSIVRPFVNRSVSGTWNDAALEAFAPTEADLARTDWTVGQGLAAL